MPPQFTQHEIERQQRELERRQREAQSKADRDTRLLKIEARQSWPGDDKSFESEWPNILTQLRTAKTVSSVQNRKPSTTLD